MQFLKFSQPLFSRLSFILVLFVLFANGSSSYANDTDYLQKARKYFSENNLRLAEPELRTAVKQHPENAEAWAFLAICSKSKQNAEKALKLNPKLALAYFARGVLSEIGERKSQLSDFSKAIELDPSFVKAYIERGKTYAGAYARSGDRSVGQFDYALALKDFDAALRLDSHSAEAYANKAAILARQGEIQQAIANYSKAVDFATRPADAYYERGLYFAIIGDFRKAISDCNEAIKREPTFTQALRLRASSYGSISQYDKAISDSSRGLEIDPNDALAYNNRANAQRFLKHYEPAIKDASRAIELSPNFMEAYFNRAISYLESGHETEAIQDFTKAIELRPQFADSWRNRGRAYQAQGLHKEAIGDYTKTIELSGKTSANADVYYDRACEYFRLANLAAAAEDCIKAAFISPKYLVAISSIVFVILAIPIGAFGYLRNRYKTKKMKMRQKD